MDAPLHIDTEIDGRSAATDARSISYDSVQDRSLLDISIGTGRKHQIRRHLAGIGFPVVGDRIYGSDEDKGVLDLQLCAYYLSFRCPQSNAIKEYILPEVMAQDADSTSN